jgi:hypothetical protein
MLLHQIYWFQHNSLSRFRFPTPLYKLNLWVCIFNLTFFSHGVLLQTVGAPLCFTTLHFMRNNRCCLRRSMAYRSLFYPRIFMFYLKNSSRCFKLLIYLICIQIVVNGNACNATWSNCLLRLLVTILFSISPHPNSNLNKLLD